MRYTSLITVLFFISTPLIYGMEDDGGKSSQKAAADQFLHPLTPALIKAQIVAKSALQNNPLLTVLKATTNTLAAPAETLGTVGLAGLLASGVGRTAYYLFDTTIGASPEQSYLAYTTTAVATFGLLGSYAVAHKAFSGRKLDAYQRNWEKEIEGSVQPLGDAQKNIKNIVKTMYSEHVNPQYSGNVIIAHGPAASGKTTAMGYLPANIKKIISKKDSSDIPEIEYYHIPIGDILTSKYTFNITSFLQSVFNSANQKAASGKIVVVGWDESTSLFIDPKDTGKNASHHQAIADSLKKHLESNDVQGSGKVIHFFAMNPDPSEIGEQALINRAHVVRFSHLQGEDLKTLVKKIAITRAAEKHRSFIQEIVEDKNITSDLTDVLTVGGRNTDGRSIGRAAINITEMFGKIVDDFSKSPHYSSGDKDLQKAFGFNGYRIAIESYAQRTDDKQLVESTVNAELLKKTKEVLKKKGALKKSPYSSELTTAHHIAPLLAAQKVDINSVEAFLDQHIQSGTKPSSFSDVILACCDDKSSPELLAQGLITPWMLVSKDDSPDSSQAKANNLTAPLGATLAVVDKKEAKKVTSYDPNLAFATRGNVLDYSKNRPYSEFTELAKKNAGERSPYIAALGIGIQKNSGMFNANSNGSGKSEQK